MCCRDGTCGLGQEAERHGDWSLVLGVDSDDDGLDDGSLCGLLFVLWLWLRFWIDVRDPKAPTADGGSKASVGGCQ